MSYERYKEAHDQNGFVVVRQFLAPAELAELGTMLDQYICDVVPTLPDADAFYEDKSRPETLKQMNHLGSEPMFRDFAQRPKFRMLAHVLAGEDVRVEDPQWFNKPPGTQHITPPHQDNYYTNLKPCIFGTIWIALDRVDEENGCLRYVLGSHLRGYRPHQHSRVLGFSQGISDYGPDDLAREVQIHLEPGDAAIHHGMTIHRADPNRAATRQRRAFAVLYKGVSCRRDEEAFARYKAALRAQHEQLGLQT
jgi:phytanoyl-CoA hydroxylase